VQGLLQKAIMTNAPDLAIASGLQQFDQFIGMTDAQRKAMDGFVSVVAGTLSPVEFFDPAHLEGVLRTPVA